MINGKVYLLYIPDEGSGDHENLIFPNGLYYIYSNLLEYGVDCDLIMLFRSNIEDFFGLLKKDDIIGLSVNSGNVKDSFFVARCLREFSDKNSLDLNLVMGGPFISLLEDSSLVEVDLIDHFFKNESEYTFVEFVKDSWQRKS